MKTPPSAERVVELLRTSMHEALRLRGESLPLNVTAALDNLRWLLMSMEEDILDLKRRAGQP